MVSVIFPAAGQGKRMGLGFNKIFTELSGKPILIQTLLHLLLRLYFHYWLLWCLNYLCPLF